MITPTYYHGSKQWQVDHIEKYHWYGRTEAVVFTQKFHRHFDYEIIKQIYKERRNEF